VRHGRPAFAASVRSRVALAGTWHFGRGSREFRRAMAATRRYEDLRHGSGRHPGIAPADIARRILISKKFYRDSENSAVAPHRYAGRAVRKSSDPATQGRLIFNQGQTHVRAPASGRQRHQALRRGS